MLSTVGSELHIFDDRIPADTLVAGLDNRSFRWAKRPRAESQNGQNATTVPLSRLVALSRTRTRPQDSD